MTEIEFDPGKPFVEIAGSVFRNGVSLVRALYPTDTIARIAAAASAIYAERDRLAAIGELPDAIANRHLRYRAIGLDEITIDGTPAAELLATDRVRSIASLCLRKPRLAVHPESFVRCSRPHLGGDLELPFHQDSRIINSELINLWIPLSDCGRTTPGLEIMAHRLYGLEPTVSGGTNVYAQFGVEIDATLLQQKYGTETLCHPAFRTGDALIFYGTTVHRTYVTPEMHGERVSIDMRLV